MLSKPQAGWSEFTLGEFKAHASFLTDIPFDWLRGCINGLKHVIPAAFFIDGEGVTCYIISDYCVTYIINDGSVLTSVRVGLDRFAEMLVQDIRENLEEWIWWCDVPLNEERYANRKAMLLALLDETQQCLDNYMKGDGYNF